jgi:uronate dehydrogenase
MIQSTPVPARPVLLTGASGRLGREVARRLFERGWILRLTDIAPFPDPIDAGSRFEAADLNDRDKVISLAQGCAAIVHFGGFVDYGSFEEVVGPNLRGVSHVFEAALAERIRVVYASSNHVIGFHERQSRLDRDCTYRPDSFYGLSKIFGEMVARFYWDKHGIESVSIRIGSCFEHPKDERMLATWLSRGDLTELVVRSVTARTTGCALIWGASNNSATWWGSDDREQIGWTPKDSADEWSGRFAAQGNSVADRFQGGRFCAIDYTRKARKA